MRAAVQVQVGINHADTEELGAAERAFTLVFIL